jgi:hypothetical protein
MNGNPDLKWWDQVMNLRNGTLGSGHCQYISGWFTHFYGIYEEVSVNDLVEYSFNVEINVVNENTAKKFKAYLYGGFFGFNESKDHVIEPCRSMTIFKDISSERSMNE